MLPILIFGVDHIPKEIKKVAENKNIKTNIFRTKKYNSVMCGYFCVEFIDVLLPGKTLINFTNLYSPNICTYF